MKRKHYLARCTTCNRVVHPTMPLLWMSEQSGMVQLDEHEYHTAWTCLGNVGTLLAWQERVDEPDF